MDKELESLGDAFRNFVRNIARLYAHGDRLKDGGEVVWEDSYAQAQLWEIIYNARLLSGACPSDGSAHYTPYRRVNPHPNCVTTYPDATLNNR